MGFFARELAWTPAAGVTSPIIAAAPAHFDAATCRYRDWPSEQRFQQPMPDRPYWGVDAGASPLALTPALIDDPPDDEIWARHTALTLWPSWTYALVESAPAPRATPGHAVSDIVDVSTRSPPDATCPRWADHCLVQRPSSGPRTGPPTTATTATAGAPPRRTCCCATCLVFKRPATPGSGPPVWRPRCQRRCWCPGATMPSDGLRTVA